jgi:predicted small lipoprotein YifL
MRAMRTFFLLLIPLALAGCGSKPPPPAASGTDAPGTTEGGEPAAPGGEPGASEGAGEGAEGGSEAEDSRTTQSIQKVVADNRKPIRACYDKALKDIPDLRGTMTIHFVLDPEGNVKKAELNIERSTIKASEIANCAIGHLKTLKFPPSSRGMDTTVNYPFDFKPDGGG